MIQPHLQSQSHATLDHMAPCHGKSHLSQFLGVSFEISSIDAVSFGCSSSGFLSIFPQILHCVFENSPWTFFCVLFTNFCLESGLFNDNVGGSVFPTKGDSSRSTVGGLNTHDHPMSLFIGCGLPGVHNTLQGNSNIDCH